MKSRVILIIVLACALSALFLAGCTDKTKDNPTRPIVSEQGLSNWLNAFRFYSIAFSTSMDPGYLVSRAYTPPGYDWLGGGDRPYPVLYMLSPFRGDERYYFEHGLAEVADRLLAEGKIQPMIIVSIDGRSQLGGSFYTDSPQQGKYFSAFITDETYPVDLLIDPDGRFTGYFDYRGPWTLESKAKINRIDEWYNTIPGYKTRAVCGVGMGGYGAFALAVKTDMFGSVSAVNAPLDFDGSGSNGFLSLINEVIPSEWTRIDTTETGRIDTISTVDTSVVDPALSLIVSASAAFSPQYTDIRLDSLYVTERDQLLIWGFTRMDSLTNDLISYLPLHEIHVPFDSNGNINSFIWDLWMDHNIQNIYETSGNPYNIHFDNTKKLLIYSKDAKFHYDEQMESFIQFLADKNDINYKVINFEGNENLVGTADHFLYDLLEDILIFHSENFEIPGDIE